MSIRTVFAIGVSVCALTAVGCSTEGPMESDPIAPVAKDTRFLPEAIDGGNISVAPAARSMASTVVTYTFDDLYQGSPPCSWDNPLPGTYQDLTIPGTNHVAVCQGYINGSISTFLIPADSDGFIFNRNLITELPFELPESAQSVSISLIRYYATDVDLVAYDASGAVVGTSSESGPLTFSQTWNSLSVNAGSGKITSVGIRTGQAAVYLDDLTIEYKGDPTTKDECKSGGWEDFGFKNQGQCVRFVETGKDSR